MGLFGSIIGRGLGTLGSAFLPVKGIDGGAVGEALGGLAPFSTGGRVKRTGPIYAHKSEFVLPKGVPPTKSQKKEVAKRKAEAKKKGKGKGKGKGKK